MTAVAPPTGFIGREPELRILRAAVEQTVAGQGSCILLSGEPGIGKTHTAEAAVQYAAQNRAQVVWGRCYEAEGAPAFWPWRQIIRLCAHGMASDTLRRVLGPSAADVAHLVPQLREHVPEIGRAADLDSPEARFRLFESISRFLENVARRQPLVIVIDDLHGADPPSLLLLQFFARDLGSMPLLLIGTYRSGAARNREHPLSDTVAELVRAPRTQQLSLIGLDDIDIGRFVAATTGVEPPPELTRVLHQHTEGNPFFLTEVIRALMSEDRLSSMLSADVRQLPVPDSVRATVGQRLAMLSRECIEVLDVAAVLGREFRLDVLERICGAEAVATALREAYAERVVIDAPGTSGTARFSHGLIREALYTDMEPMRRRERHRRGGETIEQLGVSGDVLAELAHHFQQTGRDDASRKIVQYARAAGDRAAGMLAFEEATRLYLQALSALDHYAPVDEIARCELLLALGRVQNVAGQRSEAQQTFEQIAERARQIGARRGWEVAGPLLARAALGYGGEVGGGVAIAEVVGLRPNLFDPQQANLIEEALGVLGEADSPLRARLLGRLAVERYHVDPLERRDALCRAAFEIAQRLDDPGTRAYVLCVRHVATWSSDNAAERLALAQQIVAFADGTGDLGLVATGHAWQVLALLELGNIDAMERQAALFVRAAESTHETYFLWSVAVYRAMRALLAGRFQEAERLIYSARKLGSRSGTTAEMFFSLQLAALRREQGRLDRLTALIDFLKAAADLYTAMPSVRTQLAFLCAELDRTDEARTQFEIIARDGFGSLRNNMMWLPAIAEAVEVCVTLGDADHAAVLYDLLLPFADRNVTGLAAATCWGSVARSLGLLATTLGRWDDAERHFEAALVANRKLVSPPWTAHTQHGYAALLLARNTPGDRERALALIDSATATAETLGMQRLAAKLKGLIAPTAPYHPPPITIPAAATATAHVFQRVGDYWTIQYQSREFRLKDRRGLQYLAYLLHHPGREFHANELIVACTGDVRRASVSPDPAGEVTSVRRDLGDAGSQLDGQAAREYQRRLAELREELEEAEGFNDIGRAARAREEIDFLMSELATGRGHKVASHAERARVTVTKGIKSALDKIAGADPALGDHLNATVKRGYFCSYTPDPRHPFEWQA